MLNIFGISTPLFRSSTSREIFSNNDVGLKGKKLIKNKPTLVKNLLRGHTSSPILLVDSMWSLPCRSNLLFKGVVTLESPQNYTSTNFEQVALTKFRLLAACLPQDSKIFREPWGRSTVLCIDYKNCPHLFSVDQDQIRLLSEAIIQLGLANSIIFRVGSKIVGWKKIKSP